MKHLLCGIAIATMSFSAFAQTLIPKQDEKGKFGYVDQTGNWIVKAKYSEAGQFAGKYAFVRKNQDFGLINNAGEELVKPKYKYIITLNSTSSCIFCNDTNNSESLYFDFSNGLNFKITNHEIKRIQDWYSLNYFEKTYSYDIDSETIDKYLAKIFGGDWWGSESYRLILNVNLKKPYTKDDETITSLSFTKRSSYNRPDPWTISEDGRTILAEKYIKNKQNGRDYLTQFLIRDGEIIASGNLIEKNGEYFEKKFGVTGNGQNFEYFKRLSNGKYTLDNVEFGESITKEYTDIRTIGDEYLVLNDNGVWSLRLLYRGNNKTEYIFKNPGDSVPELTAYGNQCIIKDNGKYGLFSSDLLLPCEYDEIFPIGDGMYQITKGPKTELYSTWLNATNIDFSNKKYEVVFATRTLKEVIIRDKATKKEGFMREGKIIVPAVNDSIEILTHFGFDNIYAYSKRGIKYVFNSSTGKVIADGNRYNSFRKTSNGSVFIVKKGKKVGIIDGESGKVIAPAIYDQYEMFGSKGNHLMSTSVGTQTTFTVYDRNGIKKASKTFINDGSYRVARAAAAFMEAWCGSAKWDESDSTASANEVYYIKLR